jgi:hypothetical protein
MHFELEPAAGGRHLDQEIGEPDREQESGCGYGRAGDRGRPGSAAVEDGILQVTWV